MKRQARVLGFLGMLVSATACNSGDDGRGGAGVAGSAAAAGSGNLTGAAAGGANATGMSSGGSRSGSTGEPAMGAAGSATGAGGAGGGVPRGSGGAAGSGASNAPSASSGPAVVYVGSYQNAIRIYSLDVDTGALTAVGEPVASAPSPSFLAFAPDARHLYAVNEADNVEGSGAGAVSAFDIDPATGRLTFINRVSSGGAGPAHVTVDAGGRFALAANYNGGNFSVLPISDSGGLGARVSGADHGAGAQAHEVVIDPSNRFVFVPNKGQNNVAQYRFDAQTGTVTPNTPAAFALAAGAGTRHLAFHPTLPYAYVINELDDSVTVAAFSPSAGTLSTLQTLSTLPAGVDGGKNSCAEIQVAPSGRFVYGSNRGHDSIVIFAVDAGTGRLTLVGHQSTGGHTPRSFHIEKSGRLLLVANQDSNQVVSFRIDATTGLLTELTRTTAPAPAFVGVMYLPAR